MASIGKTAGETLNKVFSGVSSFFGDINLDGIGRKFATAVNNFINTADWMSYGLSIGKGIKRLVREISDFIKEIDWDAVGDAIGEMIKGIDFKAVLSGIAELIMTAIQGLLRAWSGAFDAAPIETAIITAVAGLKFFGLGHIIATAIFDTIKTAILGTSGTKAATEIATAVGTQISTGLSGAAESGTLLNGAGASAGIGNAIMTGIAEGGAIGVVAVAAKAMAQFNDELKGGNGILSEYGGAMDSFIAQLTQGSIVTGDQADSLFLMKEELENNGASVDSYASSFALALGGMGVSGRQLSGVITTLATNTNLTDDQLAIMTKTAELLGYSMDGAGKKINLAGVDGGDAINFMRSALDDLIYSSDEYGQRSDVLQTELANIIGESESAEEVFSRFSTYLQEAGYDTSDFANAIKKYMPQAFNGINVNANKMVVTVGKLKKAFTDLSSQTQSTLLFSGMNATKEQKVRVIAEVDGIDTSNLTDKEIDGMYAEIIGTFVGGQYSPAQLPAYAIFQRAFDKIFPADKEISTVANFVKRTIGSLVSAPFDSVVNFVKRTLSGDSGSPIDTIANFVKHTLGSTFNKTVNNLTAEYKTYSKASGFNNTITGLTGKVSKTERQSGSSLSVSNVTAYINHTTRQTGSNLSVSGVKGEAAKGAIIQNGNMRGLPQFANGGIITSQLLRNIPKYASGGTPVHGSLIMAGEAGAEIVGTVGGRSEVLNRSQIASAIYSAVKSAMIETGGNGASSFNVYVGGEQVTDVVVESINRRTMATGASPLLI